MKSIKGLKRKSIFFTSNKMTCAQDVEQLTGDVNEWQRLLGMVNKSHSRIVITGIILILQRKIQEINAISILQQEIKEIFGNESATPVVDVEGRKCLETQESLYQVQISINFIDRLNTKKQIFDSIIKPIQDEAHLERQPTTKSTIQLHTTDSSIEKSIGEQNTSADKSSQEGSITQITIDSSHTYAKELLPSANNNNDNYSNNINDNYSNNNNNNNYSNNINNNSNNINDNNSNNSNNINDNNSSNINNNNNNVAVLQLHIYEPTGKPET